MNFESIEKADVASADDVVSDLSGEELLSLIQKLPDGYRTIFNLYAIEGYSHEEIGKLLGIEAVTSRTQLLKARRILQQKIQELTKAERYDR